MADGGRRTDMRRSGLTDTRLSGLTESAGAAGPVRWARWPGLAAGPALGAAALTAVVALVLTLAAFGNLTDFGTNQQFVRHVLAMDTTFRDPDLMWRAVTSPRLQNAVYVGIIAWEVLAAAVLLRAVWLWGAALRGGSLWRARAASSAGLVMVLLLFGLGFLAVGGEWFAMWQSEQWNGLDAASRNTLLAAVALVLVHLPSAAGPDRPGASDRPGVPDRPGASDRPGVPDRPGASDRPGVPDRPGSSDRPGTRVEPGSPVDPGSAAG
ncbi:DUF2165 family protein [Streptomyces sp. NPDC046876]|uniref:DUF2165 domain-containing protein n=1 Tax=Streptomyces sp. NPDC046876 TaxID=3155616 RepID=UPI00340A86D4